MLPQGIGPVLLRLTRPPQVVETRPDRRPDVRIRRARQPFTDRPDGATGES